MSQHDWLIELQVGVDFLQPAQKLATGIAVRG
jgi:hypothetical protein